MAQLYYQNLEVDHPEGLMRSTFYGLKIFYDFLKNTKNYMESDAAVKRLAWRDDPRRDEGENTTSSKGFWIQLKEPKDRPNEPESTFRAFLDEGVSSLYESPGRDAKERHTIRHDFHKQRRIEVHDRDPKHDRLLLDRRPDKPELLLRPNTWQLICQIHSLQALQNEPDRAQLPLLRLFQPHDHARWPAFDATANPDPIDWMVLTDTNRQGTDEQRRFVQIALATPDFAFLEGPPGSGKTTAICELVLQLARKGKRVLLCASTHVAVDNVLERLMDERNRHRDLIIPIRIGDRRNVSQQARRWQFESFVKEEHERLLRELRHLSTPSDAQQKMRDLLSHGPSVIERLVLESANMICGTTIGILQHPDIKDGKHQQASFDVLIIDEASKTTFQEFLVPAMLAKRWIIVGDPRQLSPYVDDQAMAINVETCLPRSELQNACIDTFLAMQHSHSKRRVTVAAVDDDARQAYLAQANAKQVDLCTTNVDPLKLATAAIVVDTPEALERCSDGLPLDVATIRAADSRLPALRRRVVAWRNRRRQHGEDEPAWASEISWRLASVYEQRFAGADNDSKGTAKRLHEQIQDLLPVVETGTDPDEVWQSIDRVRRVALPSVLESLRYGFERSPKQRQGTALSDGFPTEVIKQRHVLLTTQHRMHSEIATFSHEQIYDREALVTPSRIDADREWGYARYSHRAVWMEVRGGFDKRDNTNRKEAEAIIREVRIFDEWARNNPRSDGSPWEIAVLTFYRGQERGIREHLRRWTNNNYAMRHFVRGSKERPYLSLELCTVDRFQGHEADLVFISFVRPHPTGFLESPNRLNVALTRARYQRVIVGDRKAMCHSTGSKLGLLAQNEPWDQIIKEAEA